MTKITKEQYEFAKNRIEELLPVVDGYDLSDKGVVELSMLSDVVIEYEKEYFPETNESIGISPSRINSFVSGKSEPSLKQAGRICQILNIQPASMLGL